MNQEIELARSLKGAPAAIFLALVLHGGPQTTKNICLYTDYSIKVVRHGLAHLQQTGLVTYDCDLRAWYLLRDSQLLHLLQQAIETAVTPESYHPTAPAIAIDAGWLAAALSTEEETTTERAENTAEEADSAARGVDYAAEGAESAGGATDSALPDSQTALSTAVTVEETSFAGENFALVGVDSALKGVDFAPQGADSAPSRAPITLTTTTIHPDSNDPEVVSKQVSAKSTKAPQSRGDLRQGAVKAWLIRGGVAPNSAKMRELLAHNLDLATVRAHVLERQAYDAGLVDGRVEFNAGLLIRKLLDGDPPPPLRCQDCLRLPDRLGMCGCDYETIIKR